VIGNCLLILKAALSRSNAATTAFLPWVKNTHPCGDASSENEAWPGVTCDKPKGTVLALELNNMGLKGTLPHELATLTHLQSL